MAEGASSCLTIKDVRNELQEIDEWYPLGIQLGVDTSKLNQFEKNHPGDSERCKVDVIQHWLSNVANPTWESLADAVHKLGGHSRLVQTLQGKAVADIQESSVKSAVSHIGTSDGEMAKISIPVCMASGHSDGVANVYAVCKSEHPLHGSAPDKFDESDLKVETQKVTLKFGALVTNVKLALKSQGITVEVFASHLLTIKGLEPVYVRSQTPLLEACIAEVCEQKSIVAAVDVISEYFSWFNHMLIENIIETFCKHSKDIQERLQEFQKQFQEYCNHRICKCPRNGFGFSRKKDAVSFVIKVDAKWDVAQVDQIAFIRDTISNILHVKKQALYLRTVHNGCIQLEFIVPKFIASAVLPFAVNPHEQAEALSTAGVQELHCGNLSLYFHTGTEGRTSSGYNQVEEDGHSSVTALDRYSGSSEINQEGTTGLQKPTETNVLDCEKLAPLQAVPYHRMASTDPASGTNTDHPEIAECSSKADNPGDTELETIASPVEYLKYPGGLADKPVTHFPRQIQIALVHELTVANVLGRDWRGLAAYIGFTSNHVCLIEQDQSPAKAWQLFQAWERTGRSSIRLLVIALKQLGYLSCLSILTESNEIRDQINFEDIFAMIEQLKAKGGDSHVQKTLFPHFKETEVILYPNVFQDPQQCLLALPLDCKGEHRSAGSSAHWDIQEPKQQSFSTPCDAVSILPRCASTERNHTDNRIQPNTVFISYYPESKKHKQQVGCLTQQLAAQGYVIFFDILCKKHIKKCGGLTRWKESCIGVAENIVVVCSPKYYREDLELSNNYNKPKLSKLKVAVDTHLLRNLAYSGGCGQLIPVVMGRDDPYTCTPIWLQSVMIHHWPSQKEDLLYFIAGVPKFKMPPVVERIVLKPKVIDFPEAYDWDPYDVESL